MLFAPFPRNAKTAHAPQSQTSIMRRRCKTFLQGDFETLWNTHTGRTPPPSPRTAQYAHKELTDIVRELVQEGSLSRAASRIFSSGLAPASLDTVQLLIGKCPAANPHTFPDHAAQLPGGGPTSTTTLGSAIPHDVTPAQRESLHKSWKDTLASLPSRSAPRGDDWRYEHLKHALDASPTMFPFILQAIQDQAIPNIVRNFLSIPRLLAFLKPDPNDVTPPSLAHGIRPIGIPPALRRVPTKPVATDANKRWGPRL